MFLDGIFMQKRRIVKAAALSLFLGLLMLSGCGAGQVSHVTLEKDGTVSALIVENFDKSYYDKEELQQMILEEAASYNRSAGTAAISVDKVSVEDGVAKVKLTYETAADYAAFNDGVFFTGSVQEAEEEGYDLNKVLSSTTDLLATVGRADLLAMTDASILITDMKDPVELCGKAVYISGSVTTDKKLKTVYFEETWEGLSYVLYK